MKPTMNEFMQCLDSYLVSSRACGHTELIKNGARETYKAAVIVATKAERELYPDCAATVIDMEGFISSLCGVGLPITLDNHVLSLICEAYNAKVARIKELEHEIYEMERA